MKGHQWEGVDINIIRSIPSCCIKLCQIMLSAYYVLDSIWDMERLGVHKIVFLRVFSVKGDQQVSQQWPNGVRDVLSELWIFAPGSLQE